MQPVLSQLRTLLLTSVLLLLAGCAGLTSKESLEGQGNPQAWQAHKLQIERIDGWQINGKIGIRAPSDSGSATLFWLQRQATLTFAWPDHWRLARPVSVVTPMMPCSIFPPKDASPLTPQKICCKKASAGNCH